MGLQSSIIEWLCKSETHNLEGEGCVKHIQTHISDLIITPNVAYKVKKSIKLDFLDFTTLEQRKHYCEEEIRLNKPRAPKVYIDVIAIYETENGFSFEPDETVSVKEYAVRMNAFEQESLLTHLVHKKEFTALNLPHSLADVIHKTHSNAKIIEEGFGGFENFKAMVADIIEQSRKTNSVNPERINAYSSKVDTAIQSMSTLLDDRTESLKIRECHGDLHLNNICLVDGELQLFDCIEFNDLYKNIDTLYDLAFLLMDLESQGMTNHSMAVLNRYLELSGDYPGAPLLPLYKSIRAYIRFMVIGIAATNESDSQTQESLNKQSKEYFLQSESYLNQSNGIIIITHGFSGSGKSTVVRLLNEALPAIHIRSDAVRKHLHQVQLNDHKSDIYSEEQTNNTYNHMAELATGIVQSNQTVILDATYLDIQKRTRIHELAKNENVGFIILHCSAPESKIEQWITERTNDISDADLSVFKEQIKSHDSLSKSELNHTVKINTSERIDPVAIRKQINTKLGLNEN